MIVNTVGISLASPAALEWLRETKNGRILQAFDKGLNLINEENKVLSIVVPAVGPGPFSLVLQENQENSRQLKEWLINLNPEGRIRLRGTTLLIEQIALNFSQTRIWIPRLDFRGLMSDKLLQALPIVNLTLISHAPSSSLASLLWAREKDQFQARVLEQLPYLKKGITTANLEVLQGVALKIAGLGLGLTPAGDDFLVGIMIGMWAARRDAEVGRLVNALADTAIPRTTALSAAWLRASARGEAGLPWHILLEQIRTDNGPNRLTQALMTIIRSGLTSGADALFGFLKATEWLTHGLEVS